MLKRSFASATLLLTVVAGGLVATSAPAAAAPDFQLPFPCGTKWRLNTWDSTHAPALDIVREPQSETEGSLLVAPASGTVKQSYYHSNAGNMIQIDHGGGHFTTYIHLQSRAVSVGDRVTQGQTIGRVGHTGPTSNGSPHLHYEQGYDANGDGTVSWGDVDTERVTARFGSKAYGPAPGGEWRNIESRNGCKTNLFGADFNSDGIGDIFSETTGTLTIWNGKGSNNFATRQEIGGGWSAFSKPVAGDFNNDGISDLAAIKNGSTLYIWNGEGGNEFGPAIEVGGGWGAYDGTLTSLGDVNKDGHDDIAAIADGTLYIWNGEGGNEFGPATEIGPGWSAFSKPVGGDFNNDGIGDIAAIKNGSTLYIWNGEGGNEFGPATEVGGGWGAYDGTLTSLGDVNKDGHDDIAAMADGTLYIWNGEGGNEFGPANAIGPGWTPYF
ncbi:VCBS repeat domain-containing M23 family metallopeptidase [Nonomuraea sp. NPDC026600]|uniref:VCBS repeat domain-containing M23 family metallopeptidase n=1 Tax=Nonomuraea sp. NPDC026600 TaxID=3155363 RepID=UPI0033FF4595